ncbi:flagellin N-terminal helical domain-containing protein [Butyrivibrio sp. MC2013]|uniref:flagellin N-terminal helical domain-containing protein n=1 Tax=Butyrivibrio sp. MC2013 TaxID=1280686 RepID=UPI0003FD49B6|nr:flagellin [Butyrivibrio sp. MC2013]
MKINYNVSALVANNALHTTDNKLTDSLERLSSGLKIVNAKDNPSGLAMARRMDAQIKSLSTADDSDADGISIVETTDGVLAEIQDMLQRMSELATRAATGTLTDDDRATLQDEVQQLKDEIERVTQTTEFNGQTLLDGTFDLKGYATVLDSNTGKYQTDQHLSVLSYSDDVPVSTAKSPISMVDFSCVYDVATNSIECDMTGGNVPTGTMKDSEGRIYELELPPIDNILTFKSSWNDGREIKLKIESLPSDINKGITKIRYPESDLDAFAAVNLELTGKGAMAVQIGANEGQYLDIRIPKTDLSSIGIQNVDVSTEEGARVALARLKSGINYISESRARLGAYQNRLEHTNKSLDVTIENMTSAYSRIMDVDMAEEMTVYSTQQVLSQAGIQMLAQANDRPSEVLQLLQ